MSEVPEQNEEVEELPVFRYLVTVDGAPISKSIGLEGSVMKAQEMSGITNDEIEIHSIH